MREILGMKMEYCILGAITCKKFEEQCASFVLLREKAHRCSQGRCPSIITTRIPNEVKMTPLDSLLVRIFSLACFQGKSSSEFSSFVGPNTLLELSEFLSVLETIF